jgi:hypothetical protein
MIVLLSMQLLISATQSTTLRSAAIATDTAMSKKSLVTLRTTMQPPNDPEDWALTTGEIPTPAPAALKSLSETVVKQISEQSLFTSWITSQLQYFPLGPGTHSWLVTVSKDQEELGYLIFTAKDSDPQIYILSEYGSSPSVPYHLTSLRQTLARSDNNSLSSELVRPTSIEPLYAPLLPLWKVSFADQETLYLNAQTMDILPWDESHLRNLNLQSSELSAAYFSVKEPSYTSITAVSRQGERNPLANLMWITTPRLSLLTEDDIINYLNIGNNLIFTYPQHNDDLGGPFAISGFHKWSSPKGILEQTIYVGTGLSGQRYLPLSYLHSKGEFRAFPK